MADAGRQVQVGGDVIGQVVIGEHTVTVRAEQSVVAAVAPGHQPRPLPRPAVGLAPRPLTVPIGRDQELDGLFRAVAAGGVIELYGPPGVGKSTLLRQVGSRIAETSGNVVFLPGAGMDTADLLYEVFEVCYDSRSHRPGPAELRQSLAGVQLLLLVDDLDVPDDQLAMFTDALPAATMLFTSTRRQLWTHGRSLPLAGLPLDAGLTLLAQTLGRTLTEPELVVGQELWHAANGSPLLLLRAGAAGLPQGSEVDGLLPGIIAGLSAPARELASVLMLAGAPGAASDLLPWLVTDSATLPSSAAELTAKGMAVATDRGWQLAPGIDAAPPRDLEAGLPQLEWVSRRLWQWAGVRPLPVRAVADHATLITNVIDAIGWAGRPDLGAGLAKAAAPLAACSLRLGAWERILQHGKVAAEAAGDQITLAYVAHEDGVRNLVTGQPMAVYATGPVYAEQPTYPEQPTYVQPPTYAVPAGGVAAGRRGLGLGARLAIIGVAILLVGGAVAGALLLASGHNGPSGHSGQPAAAGSPTPRLSPTSTSESTLTTSSTPTASSSLAPPTQTTDPGPAGVVESYCNAITNQDYQTAWNIGGQNAGGSYSSFVAGFAGTAQDTVTVDSVQGNTVVADLVATQTDGTQHTYHGTYTVTGNTISKFSVQQTG